MESSVHPYSPPPGRAGVRVALVLVTREGEGGGGRQKSRKLDQITCEITLKGLDCDKKAVHPPRAQFAFRRLYGSIQFLTGTVHR